MVLYTRSKPDIHPEIDTSWLFRTVNVARIAKHAVVKVALVGIGDVLHAGCQEAFTGCPGNVLWVDNIRLAY